MRRMLRRKMGWASVSGVDLSVPLDAALKLRRQMRQRGNGREIGQDIAEAKSGCRLREVEMGEPVHGAGNAGCLRLERVMHLSSRNRVSF